MRVFSVPFWLPPRPRWGAVRLGFALATAAFAFLGFIRYGEAGRWVNRFGDPIRRDKFDEAMLWLGLSLVCRALLSWGWRLPRPASARRKAVALVRPPD